MKEPHVIMPIESTAESVKRDIFTVASCWMLILPGWWIGSSAAQWIGGMMFAFVTLVRASSMASKHKMSLTEARDKINAMIAARDEEGK